MGSTIRYRTLTRLMNINIIRIEGVRCLPSARHRVTPTMISCDKDETFEGAFQQY